MKVKLRLGDCRNVLKKIPDSVIHSVVTDPPYEIEFLNKKWDATGIAFNVNVWKETLRVMKPGGFLLAFGGTRTIHRMICAIEDAGFIIRDQIAWHYSTGLPKGQDVQGQINKKAGVKGKDGKWKGYSNQLKPATELVVVAQKPFKGTIADNVQEHGTGVMNIDACRIGNTKRALTIKKNPSESFSGGWPKDTYEKDGYNPNMGRYPSNLIHDGSLPITKLFPENAGGGHWPKAKVSGFGKFGGGKSSYEGVGEKDGKGSAARFFYCTKASRRERDLGMSAFPLVLHDTKGQLISRKPVHNTASGKIRNVKPARNTHATVKPLTLMRYLVKLVTVPGGWCLDSFMGSGTTGMACCIEGFKFLGIEKDKNHFTVCKARIRYAYEHAADFHKEKTKHVKKKSPVQNLMNDSIFDKGKGKGKGKGK